MRDMMDLGSETDLCMTSEERTKDKMKNKKIMMWTDAEKRCTQEKAKLA